MEATISRRRFVQTTAATVVAAACGMRLTQAQETRARVVDFLPYSGVSSRFAAISDISYEWYGMTVGIPSERDTTFPESKIAVLDCGYTPAPGIPSVMFNIKEGRDYADSGNTLDEYNHGISVATIIALVNPYLEIISHKIFDKEGYTVSYEKIAEAIVDSVDKDKATGIVMCIAGAMGIDSAVYKACEYARSNGVWIMASAGNAIPGYPPVAMGTPASFSDKLNNIIGVCASDENNLPTSWTNFPRVDWEDTSVYAPGVGILCYDNQWRQRRFSGTSAATPLAAALRVSIESALRRMNRGISQIELEEKSRLLFYESCAKMDSNLEAHYLNWGIPNLTKAFELMNYTPSVLPASERPKLYHANLPLVIGAAK